MKIRITTGLREGIKDNEASAVLKCLHSLGFTNVTSVRMGKFIDVTGDGRKLNSEKIAESLVNPVMEDYTIEKLKEKKDDEL